ncbi:MAG: STAS domain-containing protein [Candidatus Brocadiae bacterium]|nr:STAS domain-containing protein [Candidatus Brocadiia bacterium]
MAELNFEIRKPTPTIALVKMEGAIDSQTVIEFQQKFEQLQHESCKYYILDMAGIKYVNSAGLGTLVTIADTLGEQQGGIVLTQLQAKVKVVFDMLHLNSFFKVFSNEQEALKYMETLEMKRKGGGKTGRYQMAQDRSSMEMAAMKDAYPESGSVKTVSRTSNTTAIPAETSKIHAPLAVPYEKTPEGMKIEDLNEVKELLTFFFKRVHLDNDEIQQVQDVLMEIARLILGKLQGGQSLFYNTDITPDSMEIKLKLTGRKK